MATLRSFRGVGGAQMVRHGRRVISSAAKWWARANTKSKCIGPPRERNLSLDGQPVQKLTDYLGALRTVVFCTEDLQLVKGTARVAPALSRFAADANAARPICRCSSVTRRPSAPATRCLNNASLDEAALDSFSARTRQRSATKSSALRRELVPKLSPLARLAYRRISNDAEELRIEYQPSVKKDFAVELAQSRRARTDLSLHARRPAPRRFATAAERKFRRAIRQRRPEAHAGHRPENGAGRISHRHPRLAADSADRRCDGRTGRETPQRISAAARTRAPIPRPGLHDLHRGKLAAANWAAICSGGKSKTERC